MIFLKFDFFSQDCVSFFETLPSCSYYSTVPSYIISKKNVFLCLKVPHNFHSNSLACKVASSDDLVVELKVS